MGVLGGARDRLALLSHPLHLDVDTALVLLLLFSSFVLALCWGMFLCCRRRRATVAAAGEKRDSATRKGLFALMFARLDEFDSLTPLIVTPASSSSSSAPLLLPPPLVTPPSRSRVPGDRSSSSSPPPPRRPLSAKTLIVPLNASRYRSPAPPLLGTPDSRVTSFETGTTKSCATIPEDDEGEETPDLISIDRTSMTYSADVKSGSRYFPNSSSNLAIPSIPPSFQLPVPTYTPPDPPLVRPSRLRTKDDKQRNKRSPGSSSSSSSLGSPASSVGTVSPIDTTGSLSDSFFTGHDADRLNGDRFLDSDSQSKYQLHRIEEESEHMGEESALAYSRTEGSIASGTVCRAMPRSISEQFEIMHQKKTT